MHGSVLYLPTTEPGTHHRSNHLVLGFLFPELPHLSSSLAVYLLLLFLSLAYPGSLFGVGVGCYSSNSPPSLRIQPQQGDDLPPSARIPHCDPSVALLLLFTSSLEPLRVRYGYP